MVWRSTRRRASRSRPPFSPWASRGSRRRGRRCRSARGSCCFRGPSACGRSSSAAGWRRGVRDEARAPPRPPPPLVRSGDRRGGRVRRSAAAASADPDRGSGRRAGRREIGMRFRAVQWNRTKFVYDAILLAGIGLYLGTFLFAGPLLWRAAHPVTWEILRIRAFGTCAFLMLTVILSIGPLARLDRRFLPLLYNRRHFGVMTFCVAAAHAWFVLDWYHGQGRLPMLVSVLIGNRHYDSFIGFPFEVLGIASLAVLFLMA